MEGCETLGVTPVGIGNVLIYANYTWIRYGVYYSTEFPQRITEVIGSVMEQLIPHTFSASTARKTWLNHACLVLSKLERWLTRSTRAFQPEKQELILLPETAPDMFLDSTKIISSTESVTTCQTPILV